MRTFRCISGVVRLATVLLIVAPSAHALIIDLIDTTPNGMDADAWQAFQRAADFWEGRFIDPITVTVEASFKSLDPGVLGSASSSSGTATYDAVRALLQADQTSAADALAVSSLPGGSSIDFLLNDPSSAGGTSPTVIFDANGSTNNTALRFNTANARALGFNVGPITDALISFNSGFAFDFNPDDGISAGQFDFVGVAVHELGHALGFTSGIDIVDINTGGGPFFDAANPAGLFDNHPHVSVLDLFVFAEEGVRSQTTERNNYFSLDGGATSLAAMSTGRYNGDGRQASHWKDLASPLGIMDPTIAAGQLFSVSSLDLTAFDVIGYDLAPIPEPAVIGFFASGAMVCFLFLRRRRS